MTYDCVIVGGGVGGLQAAIQLGRYRRSTLVVDANVGRSTLCRRYRNLLGWPGGISGPELRTLGRKQAEQFGVAFIEDTVTNVRQAPENEGEATAQFHIETKSGRQLDTRRMLLATGVIDNLPNLRGLSDCLGISVYVCPDCDGYEAVGRKTVVLGQGEAGVNMALTLRYFSADITFIDHAGEPMATSIQQKLRNSGIPYIRGRAKEILSTDNGETLSGIILESNDIVPAERAFTAFGHNRVNSDLVRHLGAKVNDKGHILTDARTKMTNVSGLYAAGDVAAHSEQTSIAMGDGAQAAIWMHKSLLATEDLAVCPSDIRDTLTRSRFY